MTSGHRPFERMCVFDCLSMHMLLITGVAAANALRQVGCASSLVERINGPGDSEVGNSVIQGRIRDGRTYRLASSLCNEAQAPTAEMAVTPSSIRKSAPTTYAD